MVRLIAALSARLLREPRALVLELERHSGTGGSLASDGGALPLRPGQVYGQPTLTPLNIMVDPGLDDRPTLNVLLPAVAMAKMSGGPNSAIHLAYRLAARGIPVRFISTEMAADENQDNLWAHFCGLTGIPERLANVHIVSAHDRERPLHIGASDAFLATMWTTAQLAKHALPHTRSRAFIYLIQDFEPGLYPWSTEYALALETYSLEFRAVINESLLADYLVANRIGRFAHSDFMQRCAVVEPAFDPRHFHFAASANSRPTRRLVFYARPGIARRNLFELGVSALAGAASTGLFGRDSWELLAVGETVRPLHLGNGIMLNPAPWLSFQDYAQLLRETDVCLSLMLSPHTSYMPLEAAACGALSVTNTFSVKTSERLLAYSGNIVPVAPTLEGIGAGLADAIRRVPDLDNRARHSRLNAPADWDTALADVLPQVESMWYEIQQD